MFSTCKYNWTMRVAGESGGSGSAVTLYSPVYLSVHVILRISYAIRHPQAFIFWSHYIVQLNMCELFLFLFLFWLPRER